jgi:hypothetical protein
MKILITDTDRPRELPFLFHCVFWRACACRFDEICDLIPMFCNGLCQLKILIYIIKFFANCFLQYSVYIYIFFKRKTMCSLIIKFIFLLILILLEFIIYFVPVLLLCLIPNLFMSLFWLFPSIYQLYLYIFTEKKCDLRIRIYLFLISPIFIILYVPSFILLSIGYSILITLVLPFLTVMTRPEYSFNSLSSIAAIFYLIYQVVFHNSGYRLSKESPIIKPFNDVLNFTKSCFNFHSMEIEEKIHESYVYEFIFFKFITLYDSIIILIIFILIILPYIFMFTLSLIIILEIIVSLIGSILSTFELYDNNLNDFKKCPNYILKIYHFITILCTPLVFLFWTMILIIYAILYKFYWIGVIIGAFFKIFSIYKNNGFYNVMVSYLTIIIKIFLTIYNFIGDTFDTLSLSCINIELDELIYIYFGINIDEFDEGTLYEADNIINLLTVFIH